MGAAGPPSWPMSEESMDSGSYSPGSTNRIAIRNLTMPPIPALDIPASPPGSPPAGMEEKFEQFLELKKQGVHFNEKLARSSALKNPGLFQKLMEYAGLDEQDQYANTLPEDVLKSRDFPPWAYKEELAKSQQEVARKREEAQAKKQRESVEFVAAINPEKPSKGSTSATTTGVKAHRGSAAERVMAGLDRSKPRSPQSGAMSIRNTHDGREGNHGKNRSGPDMKSPKGRKRSRSR